MVNYCEAFKGCHAHLEISSVRVLVLKDRQNKTWDHIIYIQIKSLHFISGGPIVKWLKQYKTYVLIIF